VHRAPHATRMLLLQKWLVGVFVLGLIPPAARAECPKLLMFDGVNIRTQTNVEQARYWGQSVGVEGFFVNNVMADWQRDVGIDSASPEWRQLRQFQAIYAKYGVSDNFIKIAVYQPHDWHSSAQNAAVVRNFSHAAALAKYAGMKGVALDLEPYVPIWDDATSTPVLAATVQQEGRMIAEAMYRAYPGMTLIVLPDVLENAQPEMTFLHARRLRVLSSACKLPWVMDQLSCGSMVLAVPGKPTARMVVQAASVPARSWLISRISPMRSNKPNLHVEEASGEQLFLLATRT